MPKLAKTTPGRRLTFRLGETEYDQLTELRLALHTRSDAETLRTLVSILHGQLTRAARRAAKAAKQAEQADKRQIGLFTGPKGAA